MSLADLVSSAVAHWSLDEASGNRADSVGSNTLTDNNTVGSTTGKFSNAADFIRTNNEYLSITDNTDLSMGDIDFTLRAWVKLDSKADTVVFIGKWRSSDDNREYAILYNSGTDKFSLFVSSDGTSGGVSTLDAANFGSPSTGTFYLIHAWHDATNNELGISVNAGTADTKSHTTGVNDGTADFHISGLEGTTSNDLDGAVDDAVILKNVVMSSAERTEDYNSGAGVKFEGWLYTLTAEAGAIAISGTAATLQTSRIAADPGSVAITGTVANLVWSGESESVIPSLRRRRAVQSADSMRRRSSDQVN